MDFARTEELLGRLSSIVDHPLYEDAPRVRLSATLAVTSMQFAAGVRVLCGECLVLPASGALRSQFEALVRAVWALHRATDNQIARLSAELDRETQQANKNVPLANEMLSELEKFPQLSNLLISLREFKDSSWIPLNSYVHAGIHAIHWTENLPPPQLLDQVFRISNGLVLLGFQHIGILTGRPGIQAEIIAATACYSSCLPNRREDIQRAARPTQNCGLTG